MKDHTPRGGYAPRQTTSKRGGMVDPATSIGPSIDKPKFGKTPNTHNPTPPRMTPRDTNPTLKSRVVEPVATRETPRPDLKGPF